MAPNHALMLARAAAKRWEGYVQAGLLSLEIGKSGTATLFEEAEGNTGHDAFASRDRVPRGPRTCAGTESPCARTGRSHGRPSG